MTEVDAKALDAAMAAVALKRTSITVSSMQDMSAVMREFINIGITAYLAALTLREAEPVAYRYDLATRMTDGMGLSDSEYLGWEQRVSIQKPNVPLHSIRNLTPLFAHPASGSAPEGWNEAVLRDAIGTLTFNANCLVAEDDLADALHTLNVARQVMREVAESLSAHPSLPPPWTDRLARINLRTPIEQQASDLKEAIEHLGGHKLLTDALIAADLTMRTLGKWHDDGEPGAIRPADTAPEKAQPYLSMWAVNEGGLWICNEASSKGDESTHDAIELAGNTFPEGTRIEIWEPSPADTAPSGKAKP